MWRDSVYKTNHVVLVCVCVVSVSVCECELVRVSVCVVSLSVHVHVHVCCAQAPHSGLSFADARRRSAAQARYSYGRNVQRRWAMHRTAGRAQ